MGEAKSPTARASVFRFVMRVILEHCACADKYRDVKRPFQALAVHEETK